MSIWPMLQGIGLGASMIIPIGAQNAFVLSRGILRNHHLAVAALCALCDMLLIMVGVFGGGHWLHANERLLTLVTWGGAIFLLCYGALSLRNALQRRVKTSADARSTRLSLRVAIVTALAVTLLNPHVYLDTVMIVGSLGAQFADTDRAAFAVGAMLASVLWFFGLALAAAKLSPWLTRPRTQQAIDLSVGLIMVGLAGKLTLAGLA